ncbi:hypothetical protein TPA0910_59820 [Streptomyces hygroscopicus subsp. sporocinereus]|uniref:Uncharacterized protein n=1 Tax=Streptomyces hygroscopicus TaxID=1912 RepID=A0ABQ3U7H1_STRHY|nr:hypothetical protein TPA0910_59820 [Streptomyces hygroscopicus]
MIKARKTHPGQEEPSKVFPLERAIESTYPAEATPAPGPGRVADRITREIQDVARRRGWDPTTPAEPPTTGNAHVLFCGARSEDLSRRRPVAHRRPTQQAGGTP